MEQDIRFLGGDFQIEIRITVRVPSTKTSVPNLEWSITKTAYFCLHLI